MIKSGINEIRPSDGNGVSVIFAGDYCPMRGREANEMLASGRAGEIVKDVKSHFDTSDIKVLQWETVCGLEGEPIFKSGPNLNAGLHSIEFARALGIDVALLANNHTGDFGPEMALKTKERLEAAGLMTVGLGKNSDEAKKPITLERNGLKIAILNFCENEFGIADENKPGTAGYDIVTIAQSVSEAKKDADIVILTLHGGHEQNPLPSPRMTKAFRFFASCGADIVFNCHTHCIGGVEFVGKVPVVYSPGNFFFTRLDEPCANIDEDNLWRTGYMPKFHFDKDGVYAFELIPYYFSQTEITALEGEREEKFFNYINKLNSIIADPSAVRRYFDGWSAERGFNGYLEAIKKGIPRTIPNVKVKEEIIPFLGVRNIFTCESHNDMIRHTMRLIEEGRIEEVAPIWKEIVELRTLDF